MSDLLDAHPERLLQELAGVCCHGYHEDAVVITACSAIIRFRRSLSFEQALAHRFECEVGSSAVWNPHSTNAFPYISYRVSVYAFIKILDLVAFTIDSLWNSPIRRVK